jgi:hypothetical protein
MGRIYHYFLSVLLIGVFVSVPLSESQGGPYTILHQKGFPNADNGHQVAVSTTLSHADRSATDDEHYRHREDVYRGPGRAYKRGYRDGYREGYREGRRAYRGGYNDHGRRISLRPSYHIPYGRFRGYRR